jgi:hypothetical protein
LKIWAAFSVEAAVPAAIFGFAGDTPAATAAMFELAGGAPALQHFYACNRKFAAQLRSECLKLAKAALFSASSPFMRGLTVAQLSESRSSERKLETRVTTAILRGRAAGLSALVLCLDLLVVRGQTPEIDPAPHVLALQRDLIFANTTLLAQNDQPQGAQPPLPPSQFIPALADNKLNRNRRPSFSRPLSRPLQNTVKSRCRVRLSCLAKACARSFHAGQS